MYFTVFFKKNLFYFLLLFILPFFSYGNTEGRCSEEFSTNKLNTDTAKSSATAPPKKPRGVSTLPLEELNLGARIEGALESAGIRTAGDLTARTRAELLDVPGVGRTSVDRIEKILSGQSLMLAKKSRLFRLLKKNLPTKRMLKPVLKQLREIRKKLRNQNKLKNLLRQHSLQKLKQNKLKSLLRQHSLQKLKQNKLKSLPRQHSLQKLKQNKLRLTL